MKAPFFLFLIALAFTSFVNGQNTSAAAKSGPAVASEKTSSSKIFRANKEQITQVQTTLKSKGFYKADATGKLDDATRAAIKTFQKDNGLTQTGTLNRATLEKLGITLTDTQKAIPISENSYASTSSNSASKSSAGAAKPKRVIFRATKDQIIAAQLLLKNKTMYAGDASGKLDDATRAGLRKFQEANGVKVTGTLNQVTLEKMGIALTDKQKANVAGIKK